MLLGKPCALQIWDPSPRLHGVRSLPAGPAIATLCCGSCQRYLGPSICCPETWRSGQEKACGPFFGTTALLKKFLPSSYFYLSRKSVQRHHLTSATFCCINKNKRALFLHVDSHTTRLNRTAPKGSHGQTQSSLGNTQKHTANRRRAAIGGELRLLEVHCTHSEPIQKRFGRMPKDFRLLFRESRLHGAVLLSELLNRKVLLTFLCIEIMMLVKSTLIRAFVYSSDSYFFKRIRSRTSTFGIQSTHASHE